MIEQPFASTIVVPADASPERADKLLTDLLGGELTRSSVAKMLKDGLALVNGLPAKPSTILSPGDSIRIAPPKSDESPAHAEAPPNARILFEDDDIIVVDKPPGLVVHPGAGRSAGTLMDQLVATRPDIIGVGQEGRWGIVHRLDRDTSGVMVVAKSQLAYDNLSVAFKQHAIHRVYLALVRGRPAADEGTIDAAIGRHHHDRKRISTATSKPRHAVTRWRVRQRYTDLSLLEALPETGRTHQIRVHLASIGLPVAGDQVYGRKRKLAAEKGRAVKSALGKLKRQALHAAELGFTHPRTREHVRFESELWPDIQEVVDSLKPN